MLGVGCNPVQKLDIIRRMELGELNGVGFVRPLDHSRKQSGTHFEGDEERKRRKSTTETQQLT